MTFLSEHNTQRPYDSFQSFLIIFFGVFTTSLLRPILRAFQIRYERTIRVGSLSGQLAWQTKQFMRILQRVWFSFDLVIREGMHYRAGRGAQMVHGFGVRSYLMHVQPRQACRLQVYASGKSKCFNNTKILSVYKLYSGISCNPN